MSETERVKLMVEIANQMTQSNQNNPNVAYSHDPLSQFSVKFFKKQIKDQEVIQTLKRIERMALDRKDFQYPNHLLIKARTNQISFNSIRRKNLFYSFLGKSI